MKLKLLLNLLVFFLVLLFLTSCGISSNGPFEKRKHLKGWYFTKKKNTVFNSADKTSRTKWSKSESIETISSPNYKTDQSELASNDNLYQEIALDKEENRNFFTSDEVSKNYIQIDENYSSIKTLSYEEEHKEEIHSNLETSTDKDKEESLNSILKKDTKPPLILSPVDIILRFFLIYFLTGLAGGIFTVLVILLMPYIGILASLISFIIGFYVIAVFFIYYILRLFLREGEDEKWSLKKTFLIVGLIYFPISLGLLSAIIFGY
ncbi:MAG TPA: hypothetical protein VKX29_01970 [Brumimicrobium sp.]|nr:hypothetical protein [Brumimicrobium sp.]